MRIILLITGFFLLLIQQYILPVNKEYEVVLFLLGIALLGIPHGAADLLVATQNAQYQRKSFSILKFFVNYLGRLLLFAFLIWQLPWLGILIFIFFAAYHFGETDLYHFSSNTFTGKLFVFSYGLAILSVLLLNNYEEVMHLLQFYALSSRISYLTHWVGELRYQLLTISISFFCVCAFLYFLINKPQSEVKDSFLLQFAMIVLILFKLSLLQGFTFYFVLWHSLLSLQNIVRYLKRSRSCKSIDILKHVTLYSLLAIVGIGLFGIAGYFLASKNVLLICTFTGLAVLTAPHMQIMYDMYKNIRMFNK